LQKYYTASFSKKTLLNQWIQGCYLAEGYSSHPDQGVTVTLRPAIPISLRETPNAVKLRFLSVPTLKNTSNLVGE
jgi:hypothetical protein